MMLEAGKPGFYSNPSARRLAWMTEKHLLLYSNYRTVLHRLALKLQMSHDLGDGLRTK